MLDALVAGERDADKLLQPGQGPDARQDRGAARRAGGSLRRPPRRGRRRCWRIDHAEEIIDRLSDQVAETAAPYSQQLLLLSPIPGVKQRTA